MSYVDKPKYRRIFYPNNVKLTEEQRKRIEKRKRVADVVLVVTFPLWLPLVLSAISLEYLDDWYADIVHRK